MIYRRRVRRMQSSQGKPETREGVGPDGKLLPGYYYGKGGVIKRARGK